MPFDFLRLKTVVILDLLVLPRPCFADIRPKVAAASESRPSLASGVVKERTAAHVKFGPLTK